MADGIVIKSKLDLAEAKAMMSKLSGPRLHKTMSMAVNDSAKQVERKAEQIVAKSLSIPSARAKVGIWTKPYSTPATLTAVVRGSGSVIPLKAFGAGEEGDGVTAKIWGARVHHPGAFIFGGPQTDHTREIGLGGHVFNRLGASLLPIQKAKGGAIAAAMAKDAAAKANEAYGAERLEANVLRQLDRATRSRSGKA